MPFWNAFRSCRIELDDAAQEAEQQAESVDLDPAALSKAEADKDRINRLLDKHRVADLDGLSERLEAMRTQLLDAQHRAQKLTDLQGAVKTARHTLDQTGSALHRCRQEAGDSLSKAIEGHLQHLKLSSAQDRFRMDRHLCSRGLGTLSREHVLCSQSRTTTATPHQGGLWRRAQPGHALPQGSTDCPSGSPHPHTG